MTTNKCEGKRPKNHEGEVKVTKATWTVGKLPEDMRAAMIVYAGCVEGPRVFYSTVGEHRSVLAKGTAEQIARYSIGETVEISGQRYQRNIGRKQEDTVARLKEEMEGRNYTFTVNGKLVTGDSILNAYFTRKVAEDAEKKPMLDPKTKKPMEYMGGVEMIVSKVITPGS